jgi:hypothetical protein
MNDYLDSLDLLARECQAHQLEFILPAHGYVLGFAAQAIAQLKAHRLKREAKVIAAMRALPHGTLEDWVAHANETPGSWWPYWLAWITQQAPATVPARVTPGSKQHPPLCDAPGTYVKVRA